MSASSSSAASSTLSRSKGAILVVSALVCAIGAYSLWRVVNEEDETSAQAPGLHRSNAIHRRRRRTETITNDGESNADDLPLLVAASNENDLPERTLTDGEPMVDVMEYQDEYAWRDVPNAYERNGQNIVQLLFRVSEDATRNNAYVHRGCECNSCGSVPIRGVRYHCANCADYDLCEACESQGLHIKTHIFYKIRVPAPSFGPILSMPVAYSGDPDSAVRTLPKEITAKLSRETGFERPELDAYWEQWTFMANTDWRDDPDGINLAMDRTTFEHCLVPTGGYRQSAPSLIFDRMFAFYDTNNDNLIGFSEFLHGIAYRKKKGKWAKIFQGYDVDCDGFVDRKDFLRMFRSYYALYRQMHRDMLGGMQEQQMISTEGHRLVNGRQPLSSIFGNDGRYPRAPDNRAGEGKAVQANGDYEINDGKGVINESSDDTGKREDLFTRTSLERNLWSEAMEQEGYWDSIMNPPSAAEHTAHLAQLDRIRGAVREILEGDRESSPSPVIIVQRQPEQEEGDESSDDSDSETTSVSDPDDDDNWLPNFVTITDEDAEVVEGPGARVADIQRANRKAAIVHAVARERAYHDARERWQRRQFYTDEEEGGVPPTDWTKDDDVLVQNTVGESSKTNSRPSYHSRSSSKVRFAEDMDDFDTRSNPSTSSRSVPERWGGIDIPDAEKDAGKEILFQVTQHAFNELLDPLFKDKEDAAVDAATRKPDLEKYQHLFTTNDFIKWAEEKESHEKNSSKKKTPEQRPALRSQSGVWITPTIPEVEVEEVRERPLDDLLAVTGYSVDESLAEVAPNVVEIARNEGLPPSTDEHEASEWRDPGDRQLLERSMSIRHSVNLQPPVSTSDIVPLWDASSSSSYSDSVLDGISTPSISRDPTMPQFRPNSTQDIIFSNEQAFQAATNEPTTSQEPIPIDETNATESDTKSKDSPPEQAETPSSLPSQEELYLLWKAHKASKEAEARGGWGRLNFEEFEGRVKKSLKDGRGSQMDYLGSWIEFCIP